VTVEGAECGFYEEMQKSKPTPANGDRSKLPIHAIAKYTSILDSIATAKAVEP
jgi:hypothetical protein